MTPPSLGIKVQSQYNPPLMPSSLSSDCITQTLGLKERNYLRLSDCSSVDSSTVFSVSDEGKANLNLNATELRLGLPGFQSLERGLTFSSLSSANKFDEKQLFPLAPSNDGISSLNPKTVVVSGNKRGFSNWVFNADSGKPKTAAMNETLEKGEDGHSKMNSSNTNNAPAAKAQVVGWPPIRAFRKNTLATTSKNNDEVDGKPGPCALYVKVSMDGAPYLRKVDLRSYATYQELSLALEKMFSGFTLGQCGRQGSPNQEMSESKLRDLLHGSEYVLTYEDKDGDWMLVGDVPWEMFTASCKRLKIMKGSDAIGLAPRAVEKCKNRN